MWVIYYAFEFNVTILLSFVVNIIVKGTHVSMTINGEFVCEDEFSALASAAEAHPDARLGTSGIWEPAFGELCINYIGNITQCAFNPFKICTRCWLDSLEGPLIAN